ncbi:HTH-type transcriptional regulator CdhR [Roseovarius sp. THAF9]|uniref:helix-turn-helix domain-containing protein n=1 Tax=Roseovarius sp. THAF9 TaxID=2587847 RepID=UPI001267E5DB|nr:helix-turn-helix domain-containing protein [Roseovarius sp. THAF9]QFT91234.1 HTH-type transcriptional regulator CdhR [Roseovarius sp. THAF9]
MYLSNLDTVCPPDPRPLRDQRSLSDKFVFIVQNAESAFVAESCMHVLQRANRILGHEIYSWTYIDTAAPCQQTLSCAPDQVLVLVGGVDAPWRPVKSELPLLRSAIRNAARVCVVGGAVFVPLVTGVLGAKRLSVHAAFLAGVQETCPTVELNEGTTCHHKALSSATGPAAAMRMMVELIGAREGNFTEAALIRDLGIQAPASKESNMCGERWRLHRLAQGCEIISDALKIMEEHIEDTLSVSQVADIIGISARKLERGFADKLGRSPLKVYRDLRLDRAHDLVTQTALPFGEVAIACGFSNVTLMKRWFQRKYGEPPCEVRRQAFNGIR